MRRVGSSLLGQVQCLVERMVPAPATLADVGAAVARDRDIEDRQLAHGIRVRGGDGVGGRATPVVAHEIERIQTQNVVHQPPDIATDRLLVVAIRRP